MNKYQVGGKVKQQGQGKAQELAGDAKEKASTLQEKARGAYDGAKQRLEKADDEQHSDRSIDEDDFDPPGPGASVITP